MKYQYFKMGEIELKTVTSVEIEKAARNRTENTNLNGDLLIDQMAIKSTVTVHMDLVSADIMTAIETAVSAGLVDITYYDGAAQKTISATVENSARPRPFYVGGNMANGIYYNDITMEFRER